MRYPDGDEDACREQATQWRKFAADLKALEDIVKDGRQLTLEGFSSGEYHDKLVRLFQDIPDDVSKMVGQLNSIADSVNNVANTIDDTKTTFWIALTALAATIAATAWWTFGGGAAVAAAATRVTLLAALRWAVSRVLGEVATKVIVAIAARILEGAFAGVVGAIAGDLTSQGLQFATGTHPPGGFNWGEFGKAVAGGAIMGAVAAPITAVGANFKLGNAFANGAKDFGVSTVANTAGGLAAQPIVDGHLDFGKALAQGVAFAGIDGVKGYRNPTHADGSTGYRDISEVHPAASDRSSSTAPSPAEARATSSAQGAGSHDGGARLGSDPPKAGGPTAADPGAGQHTTQSTPNGHAASNPTAASSGPRVEAGSPSVPRAEGPQSNSGSTSTPTNTPTGTRAGVVPTGASPSAAHPVSPAAHVADSAARPAPAASTTGDRPVAPATTGEPTPRSPSSEAVDRPAPSSEASDRPASAADRPAPAGEQAQPRPSNSGDRAAEPAHATDAHRQSASGGDPVQPRSLRPDHVGVEPTASPSKSGLPAEAPRAPSEPSAPADRPAGQLEPPKPDGQQPVPRSADDLAARTPVDNQAAAARTSSDGQPAAPKTAPDNQPAAPRPAPESQPAAQKVPVSPESKSGARLSADSDAHAAKQTPDSEVGQDGKRGPATADPKLSESADPAVPAVAPPAMPAIGGEPVARAQEGRASATPSGARTAADPNRSSARSGDSGTATEPRRAGVDDSGGEQPRGPNEPLGDVPISKEMSDEIRAMEKGDRPPPESYLPPEYIKQHLERFSEGATRFMPESNLNKYGIAQRDGTSFVMPKVEADAMLARTQGDPRAMERELGLTEGFLDSNKLVRIDIPEPHGANARIPSGNEAGANEKWLPGGKLPDGASEAVIDGGKLGPDRYTVTDLETKPTGAAESGAKPPTSSGPARTEGARLESDAKPPVSSESGAKPPTAPEPTRTEGARLESEAKPPTSEPEAKAPTSAEPEAKPPTAPEPTRTEGARLESEAKPPTSEPEAKAPISPEPARTESARSEELSTGRDSAPEESVASQDHDPSARSEPSVDRDPNEAGRDVASHPDAEHAREIANDALWRREPPVSPDEIRRQLGNDPHNEQRAADNTRWWERLSGEEQRALIDTYPREIGNAEGIPPWARTEASTHELTRLHDELQARKDAGEHLTRAERKELKRYEGIQRALDDAHSWAQKHGGEVNILAFDPHAFGGDGRMVVSVGENPFRADAVSWHVPGYSTTIDKIGGNLENARAHLESVWKEGGTKVSSIAWIGYDAPQGLFKGLWDVSHTKLASAGGDILHGDITAFNAARDVIAGDGSHFSTNDIFAHSYGTTTSSFAGEGARLGNEVRSVTLAGSPGAGPIGKAADFGVGDKVFVASSSRDPITMLGGRTADSAGRFFGKGLGFDPAMEGFGGQRVTAEFPQHMDHLSGKHGTVSTHTAYYKFDPILGVRTESLANFGRIGAGHFDQVHHEVPRTVDDRPGWQPGWRTDEPAAGRPLRLDHDVSGQYSSDRRIWDPRWHEGYREPDPGQVTADKTGSSQPAASGEHTGDHSGSPAAPNVSEHPVPQPAKAPAVEGQDYGLSPQHAFELMQNPADDVARLHEGGVPSTVTDGYDPLAGRTIDQFEHEFTVSGRDGNPRWDWDGQAPNNGFAGLPTITDRIPQGYQLDRLGSNGGGFMADEGAPLATRAMPPGVANQYHTFEGTGKSIPDGLDWEVHYGPAKSAFGQPGGANQWAVIDRATGDPVSVDQLLKNRLIRETTGR
ncbi:hypothetical protein BKG80_14520 [Mycobacteroides chelonae]|nr:hypothetical protein AOT86_10765 [Mycobacteroides sp. H072]KRQ41730.1 hypothetical protein AOT84_00880 [Mycobacteroides sp. H002]KRQ53950.1 hypothetical protein AOT85_06270 [Mycobacteroides sp. H054]KRQ71796.1 hypothetical protein AOT83_05970 [Mycobacteroides sp. H001]OHU37059.1 hypothetical protein BKG79_15685 [Mycobacteroides chelonae]